MIKAVTVMLDDIVNNFTPMLSSLGIEYDAKFQSISDQKFRDIFYTPTGELKPLAVKVMGSVSAKDDGIGFCKWLKENGWLVVLCTERDIRMSYDITKTWLDEHDVQYDYLFTATTPAGLCLDMAIPFMIYNLPKGFTDYLNLISFRTQANDNQKEPYALGDFQNFEDVKQCLQSLNF
jgi:hypothetical protein